MKKISEMSPLEAMDAQTFSIVERLLRKAKTKAEAAQAAENMLFKALEDMCIDAESVHSDAEDAENLKEAICCFLSYDEYSVAGIMREIKKAYGGSEYET